MLMREDTDEPPHSHPPDADASVVELVARILGDARDLAMAHLDGIRQEVRVEASNLATTVRFTSVMLCVATVALIFAGLAAVYGITAASGLPLWASCLIMSAVFLATALIIREANRRRRVAGDEDLVPQHGIAKIKRDAEWLADRARQTIS
jgi:hypothetical protein